MKKHTSTIIGLIAFALVSVSNAEAATLSPSAPASTLIDFEDLKPGAVVTNTQIENATFSVINQGTVGRSKELRELIIFDGFCDGKRRNCSGQDSDLFFPQFGNILIISEDNDFNDPDDSIFGGTIIASFDSLVTDISVTLLDIQRGRFGRSNSVAAFLNGELVALVDGLFTRNNGALRLSLGDIIADEIRISLAGPGAIGAIRSTPVPVPAALPLFLSGLGLLALGRRKVS